MDWGAVSVHKLKAIPSLKPITNHPRHIGPDLHIIIYEWINDSTSGVCCVSFMNCSDVFHVYVHWMRQFSSYPDFLHIGSRPAECSVCCRDRAGIVLKCIPPWWFWGSVVSLYMNRTPEGSGVRCFVMHKTRCVNMSLPRNGNHVENALLIKLHFGNNLIVYPMYGDFWDTLYNNCFYVDLCQ